MVVVLFVIYCLPLRISSVNVTKYAESRFGPFIEEILNEKLHFLWSDIFRFQAI